MKTIPIKHDQKGDTIIEVVIAITLIVMLMAGALALTRTNLLDVRSAQEHGEALQIAQTQIEDMRAYLTATNVPPANFCINNNDGNIIETDLTNCSFSGSGEAPASQPVYSVTDSPPVASSNTYKVSVSWANFSGVSKDNISLYYDLFPQ